jgi:hypothetical protein
VQKTQTACRVIGGGGGGGGGGGENNSTIKSNLSKYLERFDNCHTT